MLLFANEVIFSILHFHVCHIWFPWFGPNININKCPVNIWLSGLNLDSWPTVPEFNCHMLRYLFLFQVQPGDGND